MSTFEEEWALLKEEAVTAMSLAGADDEGSREMTFGPMGGMTVTSEAWTKYAQVISAIRGSTQGCLTQLSNGQQDLKTNTDGFTSATVHGTVAASWRKRLEAVRDECEELASAMLLVRETYDRTEQDTIKSFDMPSRDR